ncbi:SPOR domain-containing protein [Ignatzschineria indica]|uniref:SPOR domain-containing protein n=1 Tax=Ignatzschineria indica TaxID=472583 RepID=UPI00257792D6|nr:SPOR domain-containing protein [Ignatzschineria indica]MDM1545479.1 SPOR domain-containing protein [Ignatzschineria indica]
MSNTLTKSLLQRLIGGIFLLALVGLIAVLLLQPSDKLPTTTPQANNVQKPAISITSTGKKEPQEIAPPIILESQSGKEIVSNAPGDIVGEELWQSVEQGHQIKEENAIILASIEPPKVTPLPQKEIEKPKVTPKKEPAMPKIELIADSEKSAEKAPQKTQPVQQAPKATAQGHWYVQLGAFGNSANAQKLMNEFKQKGYNVRILRDNKLNRVQIGPYATKKEAEQVQSRTRSGSLKPSVVQAK